MPEFAAIPVKVADGTPVLLGDVARISDGFADQTNVVRVNGRRATYLAILKHAEASTLAVVDAVTEALPDIKAAAPEGLELKIDFDQSLFVRGAIWSVLREALISSLLVSLMIGAFLGSWRSMVIVCTSIPLAIFAAHHRAQALRPHHQHHDPGRAGAGHRHAGRRRHRRGREHPPQPRAWASR